MAALPDGEAPIADTNFKHVTIAPDGTLILKSQTRPVGCTLQGTIAIMEGTAKEMKLPPSVMVAVDPKTLEALDMFQLPQTAASPRIIAACGDRIAIYVPMFDILAR